MSEVRHLSVYEFLLLMPNPLFLLVFILVVGLIFITNIVAYFRSKHTL